MFRAACLDNFNRFIFNKVLVDVTAPTYYNFDFGAIRKRELFRRRSSLEEGAL
jgi:hypothetical protein